jgi:hypothetical protein
MFCLSYEKEHGRNSMFLAEDLTIRECIEFSFYNWISWAGHKGYSRDEDAVRWIRKM